MKFLDNLFRKKTIEVPLDALYFRLYLRENRMARWNALLANVEVPIGIIDNEKQLLSKVKAQIAERQETLRQRAIDFGGPA